jgi:carboxypeptidase Q
MRPSPRFLPSPRSCAHSLPFALALLASACIVIVDPEPKRPPHTSLDSGPVTDTATAISGAAVAIQAMPASAPAVAPAARLIELARADNRVQDHLHYLTVRVGPRLTGSHGLMEAERWCRDQFTSWGLDARLERWGEFPVGFDRGPRSGAMVAPDEAELVFTTPAWTPGTDGPVRGPALIYPADDAALEALRPKLAGAWVVRAAGPRPQREWTEKVDKVLVECGVAGVVSGARGEELVITGGNHEVKWEELPKLVTIVLRGDQHTDLCERLDKGQDVQLEFDVENHFFQGPVALNNVVADLKGSEKPDEYVIVCGHLDSWDGAQGALDNGTGVSTTLEAARLLAKSGLQPKRTIRFILWSGEEQGLLGSRAYVEQNAEIMPRVSAVLNHDEGTNYLSGLRATPEMMPALHEILAPLVDLDPSMPFELVETDSFTGGGSDHASFVRAGVPGFFWMQTGRSNYDRHHHTQYDTFDAAIPAYQRHSSLVVALAAFGIANWSELLDRRNMAPIDPRRLGVQFDGMKVDSLTDDGKAKAAGFQVGDVLVSVDGTEVTDRRALSRLLQQGEPRKEFTLKRGEETIVIPVDWTGDPGEVERARRAEERAAAREKAPGS